MHIHPSIHLTVNECFESISVYWLPLDNSAKLQPARMVMNSSRRQVELFEALEFRASQYCWMQPEGVTI